MSLWYKYCNLKLLNIVQAYVFIGISHGDCWCRKSGSLKEATKIVSESSEKQRKQRCQSRQGGDWSRRRKWKRVSILLVYYKADISVNESIWKFLTLKLVNVLSIFKPGLGLYTKCLKI